MAEKYWYRITIDNGACKPCNYSGSSPYNEEELVRRIEAGRMIRLDEPVAYVPEGENPAARHRADSNPNEMGRIYLTAERIVALIPLKSPD